jgi:hypothetical protein
MYFCLVMVFYWLQGLVVTIIIIVEVPCLVLHESRSTHSLLHHVKDDKNTRISKMIDNTCNRKKQKVQSYDLRIVAWHNGCQLKNTQMARQTQQEYAHTTHNPYYGCCAVKSNHQNFLLIA